MKYARLIDLIVLILLIVGGLNWGFEGLFRLDLISSIFGEMLSRIIFILVGIAAVYRIIMWARTKAK